MRLMRNFWFSGFDNVIHPGTNGKMIEICAAMGLVNLDHVDKVIDSNRRNYPAIYFLSALSGISGLRVMTYDKSERNNFQYIVLELDDDFPLCRDDLVVTLRAENVLARKYFWPGCHNMQPYRDLFRHAGLMLTNTQAVAKRVIVMPSGPLLPEHAIKTIALIIATSAGQQC